MPKIPFVGGPADGDAMETAEPEAQVVLKGIKLALWAFRFDEDAKKSWARVSQMFTLSAKHSYRLNGGRYLYAGVVA